MAMVDKMAEHTPAYPSVEAMKAAVELEIQAALANGRVPTVVIGQIIQRAIDASLEFFWQNKAFTVSPEAQAEIQKLDPAMPPAERLRKAVEIARAALKAAGAGQ